MQPVCMEKKRLNSFLTALSKKHELIAPIKKDLVRFLPLNDPSQLCLDQIPYFPLKEYFFKKEEVLFKFIGNTLIVPQHQARSRVFFGVRKCDLNAIRHQDMVFINDLHDPYYETARKNSYLLGYHCNTAPSPYCFCGSMNLVDFFDLMFYDKGESFFIEVGSDNGREIITDFCDFFTPSNRLISQDEKKIPGTDRLISGDISSLYDHPDWKKGVDICLSCGACTTLCPTCYCFEVHDELDASEEKKGKRLRSWSSCQLLDFTRVAGNHVFREKREERFKHRIYHQLDYFRQKYGIDLCVGCGRCITGCPTRIDFVEIINGMRKPHEES